LFFFLIYSKTHAHFHTGGISFLWHYLWALNLQKAITNQTSFLPLASFYYSFNAFSWGISAPPCHPLQVQITKHFYKRHQKVGYHSILNKDCWCSIPSLGMAFLHFSNTVLKTELRY